MKPKIINDPVYGFISIDDALILTVFNHPSFQRLRRVHQMALAQFVYPGAVHTRLHHSLGAYHLICCAIEELRKKDVAITNDEAIATKIAILLHDVGHGPFSHALEQVLMPYMHHEAVSLSIMQQINLELNGALTLAISIFTNTYHKHFLHQLISSQIDVDRMDYLTRDSFFTGVNEGVIGYDRILKMLTVHNGSMVLEEKAIYSAEKFLIARRQMYWQVYLHKTVLASEKMLVKIIERVRLLSQQKDEQITLSPALAFFLTKEVNHLTAESLEHFLALDDYDVYAAIKQWSKHTDIVLSTLCKGILERKLLKCKLQITPFNQMEIAERKNKVAAYLGISLSDANYLVFTGEAINTTYQLGNEQINILFKDGTIKDITNIDNPLVICNALCLHSFPFCFLLFFQ